MPARPRSVAVFGTEGSWLGGGGQVDSWSRRESSRRSTAAIFPCQREPFFQGPLKALGALLRRSVRRGGRRTSHRARGTGRLIRRCRQASRISLMKAGPDHHQLDRRATLGDHVHRRGRPVTLAAPRPCLRPSRPSRLHRRKKRLGSRRNRPGYPTSGRGGTSARSARSGSTRPRRRRLGTGSGGLLPRLLAAAHESGTDDELEYRHLRHGPGSRFHC